MSALIEEWKQKDPFLLDLTGFQQFCDIRAAGNRFPIYPDDLFRSVEPIKKEWHDCLRHSIGQAVGTCEPQESADDYWKRSSIASQTVKAVIALCTSKAGDDWPDYLTSRHLEWIESEFGFALAEEDFDKAWELWEHPYWFSANNGYYIKGWLAVADGLGIGAKAREILEITPFPHADHPKSRDSICKKRDVCPIYQYREYLKTIKIDIPDEIWKHHKFRSNLNYFLNICPVDNEITKEEALQRINKNEDGWFNGWYVKWSVLRMMKEKEKYADTTEG